MNGLCVKRPTLMSLLLISVVLSAVSSSNAYTRKGSDDEDLHLDINSSKPQVRQYGRPQAGTVMAKVKKLENVKDGEDDRRFVAYDMDPVMPPYDNVVEDLVIKVRESEVIDEVADDETKIGQDGDEEVEDVQNKIDEESSEGTEEYAPLEDREIDPMTAKDIEEPNTGDVGSDEESVDIITTEQIQVELESEDNLEVVGERNEEDKVETDISSEEDMEETIVVDVGNDETDMIPEDKNAIKMEENSNYIDEKSNEAQIEIEIDEVTSTKESQESESLSEDSTSQDTDSSSEVQQEIVSDEPIDEIIDTYEGEDSESDVVGIQMENMESNEEEPVEESEKIVDKGIKGKVMPGDEKTEDTTGMIQEDLLVQDETQIEETMEDTNIDENVESEDSAVIPEQSSRNEDVSNEFQEEEIMQDEDVIDEESNFVETIAETISETRETLDADGKIESEIPAHIDSNLETDSDAITENESSPEKENIVSEITEDIIDDDTINDETVHDSKEQMVGESEERNSISEESDSASISETVDDISNEDIQGADIPTIPNDVEEASGEINEEDHSATDEVTETTTKESATNPVHDIQNDYGLEEDENGNVDVQIENDPDSQLGASEDAEIEDPTGDVVPDTEPVQRSSIDELVQEITSQTLVEEQEQMEKEADPIEVPQKKTANDDFVNGLDDLHKFLEEVDPPDELDVGASGLSMQDVLIGQGLTIIKARIQKGAEFAKKSLKILKKKGSEQWTKFKEVVDDNFDINIDEISISIVEKIEQPYQHVKEFISNNEEKIDAVKSAVTKVIQATKGLLDRIGLFDTEEDGYDFDGFDDDFEINDVDLAEMRKKLDRLNSNI